MVPKRKVQERLESKKKKETIQVITIEAEHAKPYRMKNEVRTSMPEAISCINLNRTAIALK